MINEDEVQIGEEKFGWNKEGGTLKEIVLRHIRKLSDISCQELTPGYWNEMPKQIGESIAIVREYHPDLRAGFINGVEFLLTLVRHCISQDTEGDFEKVLVNIESRESIDFKKADDEGWSGDDWTLTKLGYRKELLKEIMLMLDRIDFFSGSDGGIEE